MARLPNHTLGTTDPALLAAGSYEAKGCVTPGQIDERKQAIEAQVDTWAGKCAEATLAAIKGEGVELTESDRSEVTRAVVQGARRAVPSLEISPCKRVSGAKVSPFSEPICLSSAQNEANDLNDSVCKKVTDAALGSVRKTIVKEEKRRAVVAKSEEESGASAPKNDCRNFNIVQVRGRIGKGSYRIDIPVGKQAGGQCVRYSSANDTCTETASNTAYVSAIFVTDRNFDKPGPAFQIFAKYVGDVPQRQANGFQVQVPKYVENAACRDELSH